MRRKKKNKTKTKTPCHCLYSQYQAFYVAIQKQFPTYMKIIKIVKTISNYVMLFFFTLVWMLKDLSQMTKCQLLCITKFSEEYLWRLPQQKSSVLCHLPILTAFFLDDILDPRFLTVLLIISIARVTLPTRNLL